MLGNEIKAARMKTALLKEKQKLARAEQELETTERLRELLKPHLGGELRTPDDFISSLEGIAAAIMSTMNEHEIMKMMPKDKTINMAIMIDKALKIRAERLGALDRAVPVEGHDRNIGQNPADHKTNVIELAKRLKSG